MPDALRNPVIVMGMARSGTTLVAEMLHLGGTSMYDNTANADPSYDKGIRYERRTTYQLDNEILGLTERQDAITLLDRPLHPLPGDALARIAPEVGVRAWGFKNPRTTLTYPMWCELFAEGPRVYTYRSHEEVISHYFDSRQSARGKMERARMALAAWTHYNEQVLSNVRLDQAAGRPFAVVRYEELVENPALVARLSEALGVPLADARNDQMRRNRMPGIGKRLVFGWIARPFQARIGRIYEALGGLRVR